MLLIYHSYDVNITRNYQSFNSYFVKRCISCERGNLPIYFKFNNFLNIQHQFKLFHMMLIEINGGYTYNEICYRYIIT